MHSAVCLPAFESLRTLLKTRMKDLGSVMTDKLDEWLLARTPALFRAMELEVAQVARGFADEVVDLVLKAIVGDREFEAECCAAVRVGSEVKLRTANRRSVEVVLLGGRVVRVNVAYLRPDRRGLRGRPRGTGRRGKGGSGLYPALAALGVWFGVTPALADEICRQVTDSDSVRAGRAALARRNIDLGHKQTLRIINAVGRRAVEQRDRWVVKALESAAPSGGPLRGCRVVAAIDGGRIRTRVELGGRPNADTGHHRFDAAWREPKLFSIYVVDADGNILDKFRPVYDGTMENCDGAFARLAGYLKSMGAHEAKALVLLGDGARWIWDAIDTLVEAVGIPKDRVVQIVDWYHAVEVLGEVADARKNWDPAARDAWLKKARTHLHAGDIAGLMDIFDEIAVGRRATAINKHRDYFLRNAHRMTYDKFRAEKVPIGSGSVESAIRRIVNMRMKGNGTFWLLENAEAMILLRSYLKAGRFDDLIGWSHATAAAWWRNAQTAAASPVREAA